MKHVIAAVLLVTSFLICNIQLGYCQADSTQDQEMPQLRGMLPTQAPEKQPISIPDVTGNVAISIEQDYIPIDHMRGLVVKVTNQSKHPVLVNCDDARVVLPSHAVASLKDLEKVESPPTGFTAVLKADTKATLIAGLTVGTAPAINDIKIHQGPILQRYGKDETRRENEMQRFGKRLMWPGETSSGTIFFKTDESLVGSKLEVPLTLPFVSNSTVQTPQIISSLVAN